MSVEQLLEKTDIKADSILISFMKSKINKLIFERSQLNTKECNFVNTTS